VFFRSTRQALKFGRAKRKVKIIARPKWTTQSIPALLLRGFLFLMILLYNNV
jgi:hypothetical protein